MTRALAIALVLATALAVIVVGFLLFPKPEVPRRRVPDPAARASGPVRARVLAGQDAERGIVLKPRFAGPERAAFTDRALAERLGADPAAWRFVEVWVVNRGTGDVRSLAAAPAVSGPSGDRMALTPLRELVSGPATGPAGTGAVAAMLVRDLAPDPARPLRKGSFRRTVYALAGAIGFETLSSAEVDGIRLVPCETTEEALEAVLERPRTDLIAALSRTDDVPGTRARTDRTEETK